MFACTRQNTYEFYYCVEYWYLLHETIYLKHYCYFTCNVVNIVLLLLNFIVMWVMYSAENIVVLYHFDFKTN